MANRFLSNIKINDAYTFPASDGTQGQVISTDGAGNLSFIDASSGGAPVIQKDDFVGDGVTTQFTLGQVVGSVLQTQVYMDGVYQEKETYSVANDVITFTSAPPNGVSIEVISFTSINFAGDFTVDSLQFTGGTGLQGTVTWNADEETLDLVQNGATLQLGQEIQVHVKNQTGSTIPDGTPVYVTGTLGNSGRLTVAPMIADGSIPAKFFLGVTTEDIANGEDGKVTTFGKIRGIDTSMYTEGQTLFVSASTAGAFQTTAPVSPNLDLETAIVINSSSNNGTIFVRAQSGYYLGMLHDVAFSGLADKDLLVYNSTTGVWENSKTLGDITTGNITTSGTVDGVDVSAFKASYDTHNHDDRYYTETEIDTLLTNKANWDTAYSWGDHALAGYLTTETDPVFSASAAAGITSTQITNWDTAYGWGDHSVVGYLTTETDPTVPSHVKGITTTQVSNWDTAYGWGDHSTAGYLTSYTETDPVFSASDAAGITATDISNWDTAYGWGDHSTAGYLTSYTETDTLDSVTDRGATTTNPITVGGAVVNGVITLPQNPVGTTYGNGISTVPSYMIQQGAGDNDGIRLYAEAGVTNDVRFIFEVVDDIEDGDTWVFRNKKTYTDYIANEVVKISGGGDITASGTLSASGYNNSNWDTAYGWGNHAGLYLPIGGKAADSDTVDNYHASQLLRLQEPIFTNAASDDTTGHINFNRDTSVGWDDFIIKHGSSRGFFGKKGIGWHSHTDSSFHVLSSSWIANFGVNSDGTTVSRSSSRAPIFYDSNDTGYYIDPTSNSRLAKLRVESAGNQNGGNIKIGGGGEATNKWSVLTASHYNDVSESKGIMLIGSFAANGINRVVIGGDIYEANPATEINFHTHTAATHTTGGTKVAGINNDQFYHISSVRSPIFYDSNNTGYYVDPTNNSSIYQAISFGDSSRYSAVSTTINGTGAGDKLILYGNVSNYDARVLVGTDYDFIFKSQGSPSNKGMFRFYSGNNATLAMEIGADQVVSAPNSSMRSPIFYDSNDTSYYMDPNGTSVIRDITISGKLQNNPSEGFWRSTNTYQYIAPTVYYPWIKVGYLSNDTSIGAFEYYVKKDSNFPGATRGTVHLATYAGSSMSVQHDSESGDGSINAEVWIDNNREVWVRFEGSAWNSFFRWRWIYNSGITEYDGSGKTNSQPANSHHVEKGDSKRFNWGDVSAVGNFGSTNIARYYTARDAMYSPVLYDRDDTGYYINPNSTTWSSWNAGGARFRNIEISPSSFGDTIQNENAGGNLWLQYSHNGPIGLGYGGGLTTAYNGFTVESGLARLKGGIRLQDTDGAINSMWGIYGWGTQLQFTKRNISTDGYEGAAMFMEYNGLYVQSDYSFRAPIFYDSNNTSYYVDPASGSYLAGANSINVAPETGVGLKIQGGTNGAHALVLNGGGFSTAAEIFFPSSASGMSIINNGFSGQNAIAFRFGSGSGNYVGGILINTSSTTYATSSDYRLKENVAPMTNALDRVSLLKPSRFNFIGEDKTVDGFIAHEAQEVVPEAVTGQKDAIGWDGNPEYQGIDQSKLVPLLVGAIQELKAEVEALKQQLNGAN